MVRRLVVCLVSALPLWAQTALVPPGTGTPADPYRISELEHLVWMGETVADSADKTYILTADIDASATAGWNAPDTDETVLEGFPPIGSGASPFRGTFDGHGHVIRGLTINRPEEDDVGLFGRVGDGAMLAALGLQEGAVTGYFRVGGLAGRASGTTISQCYATGTVAGWSGVGGVLGSGEETALAQCYATGPVTGVCNAIGGLAGDTQGGSVAHCFASGDASGEEEVGGLVGYNSGCPLAACHATGAVTARSCVGGLVGIHTRGTIVRCRATGAVTGGEDVGGLLGACAGGAVRECFATGAVAGGDAVGGLIGAGVGGLVFDEPIAGAAIQCFATGTVSGQWAVGGLVGAYHDGAIRECYATGAVSGTSGVGGLIGFDFVSDASVVTHCYAVGRVAGGTDTGGLVGFSFWASRAPSCYWNTTSSGWATSAGGEGRTTAEMQAQETYESWDFVSLWGIAPAENSGYPGLRALVPGSGGVAVVGAPGVANGRGLWDFSGTYAATVAGNPLALVLVHDARGRLTGTATYTVPTKEGLGVVPVPLDARGHVRDTAEGVVLDLSLKGSDAPGVVRVTLGLVLALDPAKGQLRGPVTGRVRTATGTMAVANTLATSLPAGMDGTWTMALDLLYAGTTVTGSAVLTLSSGGNCLCTVAGRSVGEAVMLVLAGDRSVPAAKGAKLKATITPLGDGWARIDALSGTLYGQRLRW